jgi:hypothetical protein
VRRDLYTHLLYKLFLRKKALEINIAGWNVDSSSVYVIVSEQPYAECTDLSPTPFKERLDTSAFESGVSRTPLKDSLDF